MTEMTCPKGHNVTASEVAFVDGKPVCPWCAQGWSGAAGAAPVRRGLVPVMCIIAAAFAFSTVAGIFSYFAYSGNGSQTALLTAEVLATISSAGLATAAGVAAAVLLRRK